MRRELSITTVIQVTTSLKNPITREREIAGVIEAAKEFNLKKGIIITEDETEQLTFDGIDINVIPSWIWLLAKG